MQEEKENCERGEANMEEEEWRRQREEVFITQWQ